MSPRPSEERARKLTSGRSLGVAVAIGLAIGVLFSVAAGGRDGGGYLVRAVFDNGSFVIPGEDVKIGGVVVGAIDEVTLTEDNKAAVVLKIDDPAFVPFREDAQCAIRLQSLIGEQFIECAPTRPRKEGEAPPAELAQIEDGDGEGQYLLPVDNNVTPVGEDLLRNITRMPQQAGWRLIISEFGAGLAGNGDRLREAVRRANPALKEFDGWVKVLADQNRLLGRLIDQSDTVLSAWVKRRKETTQFIDQAGATAAAAADRGDDIERNWQRFPGFLREFKPTAARLSGLSKQMAPALETLDARAPAINSMVANMGPFFEAATPALTSLGDFGDRARVLFPALRPLIRGLNRFGRPLRPASKDLADLLGSWDDTGGIEELMKLIYFYTGTVNGVDAMGHYVRTNLVINGQCITRTPSPASDCISTLDLFGNPVKAAAALNNPMSADEFKRNNPNGYLGADLNDPKIEPLLNYFFGGGK